MKKGIITIIFLCCCAASLLVTRAAATDEEINVASGDALMRVDSGGTTRYQGLFSDSWSFSVSSTQATNSSALMYVFLPVSIVGDHTYIYTLTWEEEYFTNGAYLTSSQYFDRIDIIRGQVYETIYLNNDIVEYDGFSIYRTVSNAESGSGPIRHVSLSIIVEDPTITYFSLATVEHSIHSVHTHPIQIIDISNATLDDVLLQLVKLTNTTTSSNMSTADIIYDSIQNLGAYLSETEWQNAENIRTSLAAVQEAVAQMSEGMEQAVEKGTKSAVKEFFEELKQEATEAFNKAVEELSDVIPVDISAFTNTFNTVYNSVSHHDTNFTFNFPAGSVTLMGNEYTFWERQPINITEVYNSSPYFRMLMFPLRFVFVYGFIKYLLYWFNKLEKLVTLHTGGGE